MVTPSAIGFRLSVLYGPWRDDMQDFRQLNAWRRAHDLTLKVYKVSRPFSQTELYGPTSQIRRSAASIGANLAEGCGRQGDGGFGRFVGIALGSASELEYHLLLASDLGLLDEKTHDELANETTGIERMLVASMKAVKSTDTQNSRSKSRGARAGSSPAA